MLILQTIESVQSVSAPSETADAAVSVPVSIPTPAADLTPAVTPPITEQVAEAPLTALDVLQGVGAEASLSELGLCNYTPVGLIQNLLEFMHVGIGLPWWGAIVAGKIVFIMSTVCCYKQPISLTKIHKTKFCWLD